jgi:hypothetical protein
MPATVAAPGHLVIPGNTVPCVGPDLPSMRLGPKTWPKGSRMEPIEYEIELERTDGPADASLGSGA